MKKYIQNPFQVIEAIGLRYGAGTSFLPMLLGGAPREEVYQEVREELSRCPTHPHNPVLGEDFPGVISCVGWANPELAHEWFAYLAEPIISPEMKSGKDPQRELHYQPLDVVHMIRGMIMFMTEISGSKWHRTGKWEDYPIFREFPGMLADIIGSQVRSYVNKKLGPENHEGAWLNATVRMLSDRDIPNISELENLLKRYSRLEHVSNDEVRKTLHGRTEGPNELFILLQEIVTESGFAMPKPGELRDPSASRFANQFLMTFDYACRSNLSIGERYAG